MDKVRHESEEGKKREKMEKDQYIKQWKNSQYRHMMKKALKLEEKLEEKLHG